MRYIAKGRAPESLTHWIAENKSLPNFDYYSLPSAVRDELRTRLLEEQGYLCAYTGLRIESDQSHVEHMFPQSSCRKAGRPELTVDYKNVVACFPGEGAPEPGYGAREKDSWPEPGEEMEFLKPTDPGCEERIRYGRDGSVGPTKPEDRASTTTIARLKLDHDDLIRRRRSSLCELFIPPRGRRLEKKDLERRCKLLAETKDGRYEEFVFAKRQCLEKKIAAWN